MSEYTITPSLDCPWVGAIPRWIATKASSLFIDPFFRSLVSETHEKAKMCAAAIKPKLITSCLLYRACNRDMNYLRSYQAATLGFEPYTYTKAKMKPCAAFVPENHRPATF